MDLVTNVHSMSDESTNIVGQLIGMRSIGMKPSTIVSAMKPGSRGALVVAIWELYDLLEATAKDVNPAAVQAAKNKRDAVKPTE